MDPEALQEEGQTFVSIAKRPGTWLETVQPRINLVEVLDHLEMMEVMGEKMETITEMSLALLKLDLPDKIGVETKMPR